MKLFTKAISVLVNKNSELCNKILGLQPRTAVMPQNDNKKHVLKVLKKKNLYWKTHKSLKRTPLYKQNYETIMQ